MSLTKILTSISLINIFLALTACANNLTTPTPLFTPPPTSTMIPSPTSSPTTVAPTPTETSPASTPIQPLLAWTLAEDGSLYVLDARHRLFQLAPDNLAPQAWSAPLLPVLGNYARPPEFPVRNISRERLAISRVVSLVADETRLFVGGGAFTQTLVLDRQTFAPLTTVDKAGIMAVDPGKHLFIIATAVITEREWAGWTNPALWRYDLHALDQPPQLIIQPSVWSAPFDLVMAPASRQLYVHSLGMPGTSPRDDATVVILNTATLSKTGVLSEPNVSFEFLSRPAIAGQRDRVFATFDFTADQSVSSLLIFNQQGALLETRATFDGLPVTDARGDWLYILQQRGLWVLRGDDFALQSVLPLTTHPPADLLLSPDGQTLYLLGNGWLTALPVAELHALGIPPVASLPAAWGKPILYDLADPERGGVQFANIGLEVYRSDDGGQTWQLLPAFTYHPDAGPIESLSISPDYASDNTLIVRSLRDRSLYRSTDGGNTLGAWTPRFAFTSDRDGNREIYTMSPEGGDVQRVTNHPANDEVPAWSPAWTRLAFQSDRNDNWDIYTIRADCAPATAQGESGPGCDLRQLTDDPADDMLPAWSPDGRYIAFVSTRDGNPEIYLMDSDGQNQIRLTFNEAGDWRPAWLPNSQEFVFVSDRNGNNDLYWLRVPDLRDAPFKQEPSYLKQLTTDPADDRDPAPRTTGVYPGLAFLSDRDGVLRTYPFSLSYPDQKINDSYKTKQAHAHPSWDAFSANLIVALTEDGVSNIYKFDVLYISKEVKYIPLTDTKFFDGHPAGAPVWWEPDFKVGW